MRLRNRVKTPSAPILCLSLFLKNSAPLQPRRVRRLSCIAFQNKARPVPAILARLAGCDVRLPRVAARRHRFSRAFLALFLLSAEEICIRCTKLTKPAQI